MKYVSLLPPEIKEKRKKERKQGILFRIVGLLFIAALVVYAFLLVSTIMVRSELESLRSERNMLEDQAAALQEYEILFNEMTAAESRVNSAMGTVPPWAELMQDVGMTLPPGIWLSDLNVNYSDDTGSFNMRGWAYNHSGVAEMVEGVEKMDQIQDLRVRVSTETTYQGRDAVQFTLDAGLLPGNPFFEIDDIASDENGNEDQDSGEEDS